MVSFLDKARLVLGFLFWVSVSIVLITQNMEFGITLLLWGGITILTLIWINIHGKKKLK